MTTTMNPRMTARVIVNAVDAALTIYAAANIISRPDRVAEAQKHADRIRGWHPDTITQAVEWWAGDRTDPQVELTAWVDTLLTRPANRGDSEIAVVCRAIDDYVEAPKTVDGDPTNPAPVNVR